MAPKKTRTSDVGTSSSVSKKRSATTSNPHDLVFVGAGQKKRYNTLAIRAVIPTRYPSADGNVDNIHLGISDNVDMLLNAIGWVNFLYPTYHTYVRLTLEFLSLLTVEEDKGTKHHHKISFRLFNATFELSLADFGGLIGYPNQGSIHDSRNATLKPEGFNDDEFWKLITGENRYDARVAKASCIHNPVFRFLHKVMACTLFARGETGGIRSGELFMLWPIVHQHPVNTCHYLVEHLVSVASQAKCLIAYGGMVTFIASKLGLDAQLDGLEKVEGGWVLDLDYCITSQMIERVSARALKFHLLIARQRSIQLLDPDRTDTRNPNNWLYPIEPRRQAAVNKQPLEEEEEVVCSN